VGRRPLALAAAVLAVAALLLAVRFSGRDTPAPATGVSGLPTVRVGELPAQVGETLARIDAGGPFPSRQDGSAFQNRERLLPSHPAGYYREYTVPTPGSADRGARRIVTGVQGERYYTDDHYGTFREVLR